jgi:hypothetical protein
MTSEQLTERRLAALEQLVIKQAHQIETLKTWHNALRSRLDHHETGERAYVVPRIKS